MIRERGNSGQTWEEVGPKLLASSGNFAGDNPRYSVSFPYFAIQSVVLAES
jgi:hypothetical protein